MIDCISTTSHNRSELVTNSIESIKRDDIWIDGSGSPAKVKEENLIFTLIKCQRVCPKCPKWVDNTQKILERHFPIWFYTSFDWMLRKSNWQCLSYYFSHRQKRKWLNDIEYKSRLGEISPLHRIAHYQQKKQISETKPINSRSDRIWRRMPRTHEPSASMPHWCEELKMTNI